MAGFYTSRAWKKTRKQALHDSGHTCAHCGTSLIGKGQGAHVHHTKELDRAPALGLEPLNLQTLCRPCHSKHHRQQELISSQNEIPFAVDKNGFPLSQTHPWNGGKQFGFSIPHNLKPSAIPCTLICGPPGSGKTTLARQSAARGAGDVVVDLDDFKERIGAERWTCSYPQVRRAFRFRDALLHRLHVRKQGHAYIVLGAPTHAERMAWCEALGKVVDVIVLDVPMNVCISRIQAEPLRAHAAPQQIDAVVQWWKHYQANGKPNNINGIGGRVKKYRLNPELRRAGTDTGNYFS